MLGREAPAPCVGSGLVCKQQPWRSDRAVGPAIRDASHLIINPFFLSVTISASCPSSYCGDLSLSGKHQIIFEGFV